MKRLLQLAVLCLVTLGVVYGESSVWKVRKGESVAYIGGTCHVLRASDYPLPIEFSKAYDASTTLVFETNLDELDSSETQQAILRQGTLEGGATLESVLSKEVYELLTQHCQKAGVPVFALNRLKPPLAVLSLLGLELQRLGVNQTGVDSHFHGRAKEDGKNIRWLENVQDQIDFIFSMGNGDEDNFVKLSLRDLEKTGDILSQLIDAWKSGDEKTLEEIMVEEMKEDYPELYSSLLVERNRNWLPAIESHLQTEETEFILVGVGHLVGEDGVIRLLTEKGYQVERVN